jgi:putative CocE/NonD family hydrolase
MIPEQKIKVEINVPATMRDGTILRADVYRPDTAEPHPTLIIRTPYDKSDPRLNLLFNPIRVAKSGYAVVVQDCRGTMASDGEFNPFEVDVEAKDGYDTVEWAAKQAWSNGKVGMYGNSFLGYTQWAAAREQPPHLVAISPGMIGSGLRNILFVGGAFQIHMWISWAIHMSLLKLARKPPSPLELAKVTERLFKAFDNIEEEAKFLPLKELPVLKETGLADFYFDVLKYVNNDEFWQGREWLSFAKTTVPAYFVTSWYDIALGGTLSNYLNMKEKGGSEQARKNLKLLIGPWIHHVELSQQIGEIDFGLGAAAITIDLLGIQLRWFDYWLKGINNGIMEEPPVRIFVMGDNVWRNEIEWPLARTKYIEYYFHSGGCANTLKGDGILNMEPPGEEEYDSFLYDPRNPVPTKGGNILSPTAIAGAYDQREVEERQDVLVYTTPPLEKGLEVTGPIIVKLFSASSVIDTDFAAKLVDVWPNGKAYNLTDGIIRARYRLSDTKQSLVEPGKVYEYTIDLLATSNVFKAGHRIRVEISSSNFPRYNRNLNIGQVFGEDAELEMAIQKIFHDKERPSHIVLPMIPR